MSSLHQSIALNNHAIIEASAGTGKTYTIQNLVLRILKDSYLKKRPIQMEQLLIVTYTDKAAGELKTRIRESLEEEIKKLGHTDESQYLMMCLSQIQQSNISTIHGFCKKILSTFPFENQTTLKLELVKNQEGLKREVFKRIKSNWKIDYADFIDELISFIGKGFAEKIVEVANEIKVGITQMMPDDLNLADLIKEYKAEHHSCSFLCEDFLSRLEDLRQSAIELDSTSLDFNEIDASLRNIKNLIENFIKTSEIDIKELPTKTSLSSARGKPFKLFSKPLQAIAKTIVGEHYPILFEALEQIASIKPKIKSAFFNKEAELVAQSWHLIKEENGLITFDDMIRIVRDAICEKDSSLCEILASQYKFGIIDEFQDTNPFQWDIFETLFLNNNKNKSRILYLVGDPKQSIYSFQGSDVATYNQAKNSIVENYGASKESLQQNFRSTSMLIDAYNTAFTSETDKFQWFLSDDIKYDQPVKHGIKEGSVNCENLTSKESNFLDEAMIIFEPTALSIGAQRNEYAKWTVEQIKQLMASDFKKSTLKANEDKALKLGDIAILVNSRANANPFIKALKENAIPYSFYKQEGIFQSEECLHFICLLKAINEPGYRDSNIKSALLTLFFNWNLKDVANIDRLDDQRGHYLLIESLYELASRSRWTELVEKIFTKTQVETTVPLLEEGERRLSNLRQISQYFLTHTTQVSGSLRDYILHLESLYSKNESSSNDQNTYAKETESERIQILTIHASKGLEFPVVFVLPSNKNSGYRSRNGIEKHSVHNDNQRIDQLWTDTNADSYPKNEIGEKSIQEHMRLNYVALTRASLKLFVPLWKDNKGEVSKDPMSILLDVALKENHCPYLISSNDLKNTSYSKVDFDENENSKNDNSLDTINFNSIQNEIKTQRDSIAKISDFSQRRHSLTSYSALVHNRINIQSSEGRLDKNEENENLNSENIEILEQNNTHPNHYDSLPKGANTGNTLHEILEEVDFVAFRALAKEVDLSIAAKIDLEKIPNDLITLIQSRLSANGILNNLYGQQRTQEVLSMIYHVLFSLLDANTGDLDLFENSSLKTKEIIDLDKADRKAEAEFHFTFDRIGIPFPTQTDDMAGYVLGYIDLIYRIQLEDGSFRYHVLDWKSNYLNQYDKKNLDEAMNHSGYDLQAKLYTLALDRYLQNTLGSEYDRTKHLGLPKYVFMRGCLAHTHTAIWTPSDSKKWTIEHLNRDIKNLICSSKHLIEILKPNSTKNSEVK